MAQPSAPPQPNRVMISYNWGSQSFATDVCKKLTEDGYNVWMDIQTGQDDGMKQDIITGMTDGLSKAVCMVVILSPKYEESQNCRTELKGAYVRRIPTIFLKHPAHKVNGETMTIMGTSLYYEYDVDPADGKTKIKNSAAFLNDLAVHCPLGSPARPRQKTRILLVGCSGVGKSSLVSLFTNGTINDGLNPKEIYVSSAPVPGTWKAAEYENDQYVMIDTMGVGLEDREVNPFGTEAALVNLKNFLIGSRKGYHFIFLVIKVNTRSLASQVAAYKMFYEALFYDMRERFVIILTHCPNKPNPASLANLDSFMPGIGKKIWIDIPVDEDDQAQYNTVIAEKHRAAKEVIEKHLAKSLNVPAQVPASSLIERSRFYSFVRELMKLLGYQWDDQMEEILTNMGMSEKTRDAARIIM